jgi:endonuclease/exonuclease/phosphatase family metal-dependent hydrolase
MGDNLVESLMIATSVLTRHHLPPRQVMDPFRLLCYNVCGFPWYRTPIREIVAWVTANADIVALQEVWCRHAAWAAAFASAGWVFQRPPREHQISGLFGSGLVFAWRPTEWAPTDVRFYPFLAAVGFDQLATKGWLRVDLRHVRTGAPLRLINTHMQSDYEVCDELWQHISDPIRMAQARELATVEARLPPVPTLVVGDFNTHECWIPGARFLNPQTIPSFPTREGGKHLDHIATWCPEWRLLGHEVAAGRTWSDHLPIRWTLGWLAPSK